MCHEKGGLEILRDKRVVLYVGYAGHPKRKTPRSLSMSTDKLHPIQESILSQLGLAPEETSEPEQGMKAWLSEFEPDMHSSLYREEEDGGYLGEDDDDLDEGYGTTRPAFDEPGAPSRNVKAAKRMVKELAAMAKTMQKFNIGDKLRQISMWIVTSGDGMTEKQAEAILSMDKTLYDMQRPFMDIMNAYNKTLQAHRN
jgi:hypothetical protein